MTRQALFVVITFGILAGCSSSASRETISRVAGCYRFDRPYFLASVQNDAGEYAGQERTSVIQLTDSAAASVGNSVDTVGRFRVRLPDVRQMPDDARRYDLQSEWTVLAPDSILLSWWNGLFGPSFRLAVRRDSLIGVQSFGSDISSGSTTRGDTLVLTFPDPVWQAASAVRVRCP